jgi:hypothetical protein
VILDSFGIAESACGNQIVLSPTTVKVENFTSIKTAFVIKSNILVYCNMQYQITNIVILYGILTRKILIKPSLRLPLCCLLYRYASLNDGRFRRRANVVECAYVNLDNITYCTPSLYGIAYCS